MHDFGLRVREVRKLRKMSMQELGEKMGYKGAKQMIYQIENGMIDVSLDTVKKLAKILGVSAAYLAGYEEPRERKDVFVEMFEALNEEGQELVREYVQMLFNNEKYIGVPVLD